MKTMIKHEHSFSYDVNDYSCVVCDKTYPQLVEELKQLVEEADRVISIFDPDGQWKVADEWRRKCEEFNK